MEIKKAFYRFRIINASTIVNGLDAVLDSESSGENNQSIYFSRHIGSYLHKNSLAFSNVESQQLPEKAFVYLKCMYIFYMG